MARYEITAPNGQKFEITAPDDATQDQVMAYAQSEFSKSAAPQISDVPGAEQDAAIAQYYTQQQAQPKPERSFADKAIGAGEALLTIGTGATSGMLGQLAGTAAGIGKSIQQGLYGTNQGADMAEQIAMDTATASTYSPRTAAGQEYLSKIGEVAAPLAAIPPIREAAIIAQTARPALQQASASIKPSLSKIGEMQIPQTRASQEAAQRIVAGDTGRDLAKSTVIPESIAKGKPRLAADPVAKEAIKQGFDEGIVSAVKQTTPVNKSKLLRMANIAEKAKNDAVFGASNRPADVAGDSLAQRIKTIRAINRDAGHRLDGVAKSLRGQKGNLEVPTENFAKSLDEMGVSQNEDGSLNFVGSDVEGIVGAEKVLKQVAARVRRLNADDAYDMHRLKRYIDEQVTYGKSTEGLSGRAERALKSLRADIDASLDSQFPEYNKVNTQYSDTVGALDAFQDAAGTKVNLFGENSEKALGTVSRRLLSNTQSRVNLIDSIKNIDDVAKKYGTKFDDDIMTQVLFADELDKVFGAAARTSLQGDVGKGVKRGLETAAGQRTLTGLGIDAISEAANMARGVNEKNAFKSIKELLKRDLKESTAP